MTRNITIPDEECSGRQGGDSTSYKKHAVLRAVGPIVGSAILMFHRREPLIPLDDLKFGIRTRTSIATYEQRLPINLR
jgi:hypothetical protein